ncbi:ABC transporter substrate-binding protein [Kitasatospora sp. NPDC058201]|uniref:ABC transporter substrate-binding protein n=1 Tax=unclassified Kitasatospora TaxID=2633591 RepID=UPI003658CA6E
MTPSSSRCRIAVATAVALTAVAVTAVALVTGAGGAGGDKPPLHDQLPGAIREAGVIQVGVSYTAPPIVFRRTDGQPDGLDLDIAIALGKVLGVEVRFREVDLFSNVIPGLLDRKYDIGMSGITDTRERERGVDKDNKQVDEGVDFVDYFMAGSGIMVRKGNPARIGSLGDLCGRSVAVKKETVHDELVTRQQKACERLGKTLNVLRADTDPAAVTELQRNRADALITGYPKVLYNAQTVDNGRSFEVAGRQAQMQPWGIALRKSDTQLRDVLAKAMNSLITDGTYSSILEKWQLSDNAIHNAVVNGAG